MKQTTRKLLQRLVSGQPRPTKKALTEFFVELKKHSVEDLMRICGEATEAVTHGEQSIYLVATRRRLREFGGKAADLLPYLVEAASALGRIDVSQLGNAPTLARVVAIIETALGDQTAEAIDAAFKAYEQTHDVSYKLKRR